MMNQDLLILQTARDWLRAGHQAVLVIVAQTWGSSPRPPGSIMALRDDGHVAGSVSGGCVEDDMIMQVREQGIPQQAGIVSYGVDQDQARRFGIPCGGTLRLVQEPLTTPDKLDELLESLAQGQLIRRTLQLSDGSVTLDKAQAGQDLELTETQFTAIFGPRYRVLLIGAGQLSALLAQIALSLDFAVTVCDPREEYYDEWAVAGAELVRTMPDDTVLSMKPDERTAIIALTHDPKLDDMALMEALNTPAFYVAALGSKLNNDRRRERLLEFDLTAQQIERLYGPAGLFIGSKTPAEIAVSIAAQMVAVQRGV
ncbi:XdhC family protein [Leucothrix mucor]|uniref:XdhC family protein n=1 Tax=Leucothrix mucor TaxID=45248 RepID=UPI0003B56FE2|nr:XdhC family protein [Leucothrix mucor]